MGGWPFLFIVTIQLKIASGGPAGGQTFKKFDKQVLNSLLKAPPVHFFISHQYMAFIARWAVKAMYWCDRKVFCGAFFQKSDPPEAS